MSQTPVISSPLKQTNEIDWAYPLKTYILHNYGGDPERFAKECSTLNRLRQDVRGAGKDTGSGRDLLYRYYGQLELLDLRFPVDENHIKISFTWFDAFTQKPTSQHSIAFEKASIIFNIAAVLSSLGAIQNRQEEAGLKTAYHSFQASAGMFSYINENFLHAPSADLNHDTIKSLIIIMIAQAQEVFFEKQVADGKKAALVAKLASQAAYLYSQATDGIQENVNKAVFEKAWLLLTQTKAAHFQSSSQYYQAMADAESGVHGTAIARLKVAEKGSKEAVRLAGIIPQSLPSSSNLSSDSANIMVETTKRLLSMTQEKLHELIKDNDFIYHHSVPSEGTLAAVSKLLAAKAISVSELYQGQDIQRVIGPDIFQSIVPMSITESASLYDEEKAKIVRAETERAETASSEMAASLDYLKLPYSLDLLKEGSNLQMNVDTEFVTWCRELADHPPFPHTFAKITADRSKIVNLLDSSARQLDMEESICEKMRSKYDVRWTQLPSSHLTTILRSDVQNYRNALTDASASDARLQATFRQHEIDFEEMRSAGETDEADILYQKAVLEAVSSRKAGVAKSEGLGGPGSAGVLLDEDIDYGDKSIPDQIAHVEELVTKLNLIDKERGQSLKDLKDRVYNDDISQTLIMNKKSVSTHEKQLFGVELEKFRPFQQRLLQANHKQSSVLKEMTRAYSNLLKDKRVRAEQTKYEALSKQKSFVTTRYRKIFQAFNDLSAGLQRASEFYAELAITVESLTMNVNIFVSNRKAEGGKLLSQIETDHTDKGRQATNGGLEESRQSVDRVNDIVSQSQLQFRAMRGSDQDSTLRQGATPATSTFPAPAAAVLNAASPATVSIAPNGSSSANQQRYTQISQVQVPTVYNPSHYSPMPSQSQSAYAASLHSQSTPQIMEADARQDRRSNPGNSFQPHVLAIPPPPPPPPPHTATPVTGPLPTSGTQDPWAGIRAWR